MTLREFLLCGKQELIDDFQDWNSSFFVETDAQGQPTKEYVYVDGLPLAVLDPGATGGGPALDLILDNGSPGVTSAGTWTATTSGSGYEGANYLEHPSGQLVVDNADTPFSTTGTWTQSKMCTS